VAEVAEMVVALVVDSAALSLTLTLAPLVAFRLRHVCPVLTRVLGSTAKGH